MGDAEQRLTATVRAVEGIADLAPEAWDACAGVDNPFVSHAFLAALEASECVAAGTGWAPHHLALEDAAGTLLGAVPMYLKGNSYGEYIFDHTWAAAYERAGGQYYPKLLVAVPFTPVPGPRLLARPGAASGSIADALLGACVEVASKLEVSILSFNFPTEAEWQRMGAAGLLLRTGEQFHWENRGYDDFDAFLGDLASRKRKAIRKERREALANGIIVEVLTGADIREAHWDAFFDFYMDTGARKWGQPYLNRTFFSLLGAAMSERVALVMARRGGRYIAGALHLVGRDTVYGRYWGCCEDHRFLHFELCYYQAIEFAIAHRLGRAEAGAQGPHKLARAYLPVHTYSAHWIRNPSFRTAVDRYLGEERREIDRDIAALESYSPFRRGDS